MDRIKVIHDSQSIIYRKPFGAVEEGQNVKLSIDIDKEIIMAVELLQFDGTKVNMGMKKEYLNNGNYRYSVEIDTDDALGVLGYYFIFWLGISLEVTQKDGNAVTGFALWSNRLAFLIWVLLTVAFYGNYLGLRNKLPFMEHKYLRWIGYFLWPMVFLIVVILIIIPISN